MLQRVGEGEGGEERGMADSRYVNELEQRKIQRVAFPHFGCCSYIHTINGCWIPRTKWNAMLRSGEAKGVWFESAEPDFS